MDSSPAVDCSQNSQTDTDGDMDDDLFIDENASPLHNQVEVTTKSTIDMESNDEENLHEEILLQEATEAIQKAEASTVGFEGRKIDENEQESSESHPEDSNQESSDNTPQQAQNHQQELEQQNIQHQKQLQQEQQQNQQQQRRIFELEREVQRLKILLRDREDSQDKIRMCLQKEHLIDLNRKENIFKMNLALKEQELQDALVSLIVWNLFTEFSNCFFFIHFRNKLKL